jgi:hypothetical protein
MELCKSDKNKYGAGTHIVDHVLIRDLILVRDYGVMRGIFENKKAKRL